MTKGAVLSNDLKHRFELSRIWDESKPKVLWIMHNPSTADHEVDDPTIRRIIKFSQDFGFGGCYVGNLSSYRATNPKELETIALEELLKEDNAYHIRRMATLCTMTILACGVPTKSLRSRAKRLLGSSMPFHYLQLTKSGYPGHPLYLKSDLTPTLY